MTSLPRVGGEAIQKVQALRQRLGGRRDALGEGRRVPPAAAPARAPADYRWATAFDRMGG
ncbi:hypothetical protein [Streptomyces sp. NRRL S-1813]|uniref:hypothetical protein n=1 Tax=Streptomyces sp. NRRL S-1813 TaxID=1463888 RepID=UPI00131E9ADC|nr:hypothetical protein [Streptomyces sp. NRRL S-1813]